MSDKPTRIFGYVRVSDEDQVASGLGLEAQEHAICAFAKKQDGGVATIFRDEGLSGRKKAQLEKRPGLFAAVGALKKGDWLVVAKRDRFARDAIEAAFIERLIRRKGARLVSAAGEGTHGDQDDPSSILVTRLMDLFAEYESMLISARVKAAVERKRSRKEFCGGEPPYGYKAVPAPGRTRVVKQVVNGKVQQTEAPLLVLEPREDEMRVCRRIGKLYEMGFSERAIVEILRSDGQKNRVNEPFAQTQVHRIIARLKKAGVRRKVKIITTTEKKRREWGIS